MTALLRPAVDACVLDEVEEHAFSETAREVGGILIGEFDGDGAHVTTALPALRAVGSSAQVTFTHEVWDDVLTAVERDHAGQRIVGWYHTHPGFGIFLSEYDLFLHRSFFSDPRMLALVIDPLAGQLGWFGWRADDIALLGQAETNRPGVRKPTATSGGPSGQAGGRRLRGAAVLGGLALVTGTFVAGYTLAPGSGTAALHQAQNQRDTAVAERDAALTQLTRQHAAPATPAPRSTGAAAGGSGVHYRVRTGDTLSSLASSFYGAPGKAAELARDNHIQDPRLLHVGEMLVVRAGP